MSNETVIETPIGKLSITVTGQAITNINFAKSTQKLTQAQSKLGQEAVKELASYFTSSRKKFSVPLQLQGTAYQKRVWKALQEIPVGETRTYGELAKQLKSSPRAVGNACRHNPIPVIVPCHRVVAQSGVGGFAGAVNGRLLNIKQWLLKHEGVNI